MTGRVRDGAGADGAVPRGRADSPRRRLGRVRGIRLDSASTPRDREDDMTPDDVGERPSPGRTRQRGVATATGGLALLCMASTLMAQAMPHGPAADEQANVVDALRGNLIASRATLDGRPITGLERTAWCKGTIVTSQGRTAFDWRDLGNFAPRAAPGRMWFTITSSGRRHVVSYARGRSADRVGMGFGMLDEECQGHPRSTPRAGA